MINLQALESVYFGNTVEEYILALGTFIIIFGVLWFFKTVLLHKLKKLSTKTDTTLDEMAIKVLDTFGLVFFTIWSALIASQRLTLPVFLEQSIFYLFIIALAYYAIRALNQVIHYLTNTLKEQKATKGQSDFAILNLLDKIGRGITWVLGGLFVISNFGIEITPLIAGLGIGGFAVAFALQGLLSDLFASISIYFDRPFDIGDFIVVGGDAGVVKDIGIKSTRLEALQGEEIVISNKELTETRVHNYKKLKKRRIVFGFGVVYDTPVKKLEKIPSLVKKVIDDLDLAEFNRVHFKDFGDFSLNYEVVYYANTQDYAAYMDLQQSINLQIMKIFEKEKIEIAFPTQTIIMKK